MISLRVLVFSLRADTGFYPHKHGCSIAVGYYFCQTDVGETAKRKCYAKGLEEGRRLKE